MLVNAPKDSPLFSFNKTDFHSRYSLVRLLDKLVFEAGFSPSDYTSWHSFCRGAAVFAFELGLADSAVQLMKGLKAQLSRPVRQKLPFTMVHLCIFYKYLDLCNAKHLPCWCALLLAFFGCFRLSNLVPISKNKFDPLKQLKINDIKVDKDVLLVFLSRAKASDLLLSRAKASDLLFKTIISHVTPYGPQVFTQGFSELSAGGGGGGGGGGGAVNSSETAMYFEKPIMQDGS